ncbi:AAT family amino acid transporter, partial [Macrophomina phaseolina]
MQPSGTKDTDDVELTKLSDAALAPTKSNAASVAVGQVEGNQGDHGVQRKLKARHIQMIAIGSNIGAGLFIGSGKGLHNGGPLSLIIGFVCLSFVLTIMMQCLAEMAVVLPVSGSFTRYASRFYDRSLGFAVGWQYWLCWIAVFGAESSALLLGRKCPHQLLERRHALDAAVITIFVVINLCIHFAPVRVFGEVEFVVSTLKILAVITFLVVIWVIMGGGGPDGRVHGAEYWHRPGLENGIANGFYGFAAVFVTAAFATGGTEMVGVVVGEAQHPRHNLPRAVRMLMWRICVFYQRPRVRLRARDRGGGGIGALPDLLNAVVMACVVSMGSTAVYISSRVLRGLAEEGFAPAVLARTDRLGRPYMALAASGAVGVVLAYMNCSSTGAVVFGWFSSVSGLTFFFAWLTIIGCNWRFHAAAKAQGDGIMDQRYQFRATCWPWLSIVAFVMIVFMIICQFAVSVKPIGSPASAETIFANFLGGPTFFLFCAVHKAIYRTKTVPLKEIDLETERRDVDPEEEAKLERRKYQIHPHSGRKRTNHPIGHN